MRFSKKRPFAHKISMELLSFCELLPHKGRLCCTDRNMVSHLYGKYVYRKTSNVILGRAKPKGIIVMKNRIVGVGVLDDPSERSDPDGGAPRSGSTMHGLFCIPNDRLAADGMSGTPSPTNGFGFIVVGLPVIIAGAGEAGTQYGFAGVPQRKRHCTGPDPAPPQRGGYSTRLAGKKRLRSVEMER